MQTNKPLIVSIIIALIAAGGVIAFLASREASTMNSANYEYDQYGNTSDDAEDRADADSNQNQATQSNPTTPTTQTGDATVYTLTDVAQHGTESSCWTAIDGGVYDFTQFMKEHPGGKRGILGLCGKDGSRDFHRAHGAGGPKQMAVFAKYKIGTLAQ